MSTASIKKIIPCKKEDLINMVLDIEKYPEYVPWCISGKIIDKNENNELIEIKGELKVGKKFIYENYSSLVLYYKKEDKILVTNIDGPLKHLKNTWKFKQIDQNTELKFDIDFELKNKLLNSIMKQSFSFGLKKIADAFEQRAKDLFK